MHRNLKWTMARSLLEPYSGKNIGTRGSVVGREFVVLVEDVVGAHYQGPRFGERVVKGQVGDRITDKPPRIGRVVKALRRRQPFRADAQRTDHMRQCQRAVPLRPTRQ